MGYDKIEFIPAGEGGYKKAADLVLKSMMGKSERIPVPKKLKELLWWKKENEPITTDDLDILWGNCEPGKISEQDKEEINKYLYSTRGIKLENILQKMKNKQKIKEMGFEEETFQRLLEILKDEDFREIFLIEGNTLEDKIQNIYYSFKQEELTKLLFCVAMRYEEVLEEKNIAEEEAIEHHETLEIIKRNLEPNSKMIFKYKSGQKKYSYSALEFMLKRFETKEDGKTQYISKTKMKEEILEGKRTINGLSAKEYELLGISLEKEKEMLKTNPENYIFFLKQSKCKYNCAQILQDIINAKACSEELFKYLCQRTDITTEEICNLFDQNIITEEYIKIAKEILSKKTGRDVTIISTEKLETVYLEYKEANNSEEKEEAGKRFERYASVYRNIETCGKTREELNQEGNEIILSVVEDDEETIQLYLLGIIPIDAVLLSSDELLEVLLTREQLKPHDAEYLKKQGKFIIDDLIEKFDKYPNMSYEYQLALVAAMCDDDEEKKVCAHYHIQTELNSHTEDDGNKARIQQNQTEKSIKSKTSESTNLKPRSPRLKYQLLMMADKKTRVEKGIIDGHIIFHYPNVRGGTVVIERMLKKTKNLVSGETENRIDNESATYVMTEEEFEAIKNDLIKDGKLERKQLTRRWHHKPGYWIMHYGERGWEDAIRERLDMNDKNPIHPIHTAEDLRRMDEIEEQCIKFRQNDNEER